MEGGGGGKFGICDGIISFDRSLAYLDLYNFSSFAAAGIPGTRAPQCPRFNDRDLFVYLRPPS